MEKEGQLTSKHVNLTGFIKKVYDLLKVNPTTKYVIQKTGKTKFYVCKVLNQLIKLGRIERIEKGIFRVNLKQWVVSPVNLPPPDLSQADYLRLHNLDIQLRINYDTHKQLYNQVFNHKTFKNIRSSGTNRGYYFNIEHSYITYMITNNNIFAKFPKDWELLGNDVTELMSKMYDEIKKELNILQTRYNIYCFKDGRINFNIRNIHIALVKNGLVEEFKKRNINNLVIYDDADKKPRYIMDMSKGLFELEAIHPKKGFDDADEAHYFMNKLKDGNVREVLDNSQNFFNSSDQLSMEDIKSTLINILKTIDSLSKENKDTAMGLNMITKIIQSQLPVNTPTNEPELKGKPFYVG